MSPADAARRTLPVASVTAEQAVDLGHGKRIDAAAVAPDDRLVAIVERRGATLKVVTGFPPEEADA